MSTLDKQNRTEQPLEFTKIQGFDVLESLPEEQKLKSYNEEFYSSLSNLKFLSLSVPDEEKLFYHFEQNKNASITSTVGQIFVTINELKEANQENGKMLEEVREHVKDLRVRVDKCEGVSFDDIKPEIENLEKKLQVFLVNMKTENFKLIKEVAMLQKEKSKLYAQIALCLQRLEKIEKDVGKKIKKSVNKMNSNNPRTFMIEKSGNNTAMTEKENIKTERV